MYSPFSSDIDSELVLDIFKMRSSSLKNKTFFCTDRESLHSESFFPLPPLCSVLSKLRFSLKCALECWSRFVYEGVVSLSRVHQLHRNKRHLRNSENQKMLLLLFSLIPPLVMPEPSPKTQSPSPPR